MTRLPPFLSLWEIVGYKDLCIQLYPIKERDNKTCQLGTEARIEGFSRSLKKDHKPEENSFLLRDSENFKTQKRRFIMRYLKLALLLVAIGVLLGLTLSLNVTPIHASGPVIEEPEGAGTACTNKGPIRFEQIAGAHPVGLSGEARAKALAGFEKYRCDKPGSGVTGSYVLVQPYRYDTPESEHHPTTKIEQLTWEGLMGYLLLTPDYLDSGSWWFELGNPPSGQPVMKIEDSPSEPMGQGSFCRGQGPLTFNGIKTVDVLRPFKCQGSGTYATSRTWHTPNGERDVKLGVTGLTFDQALAQLLTPPRNDNSGALSFYPVSSASIAQATTTPIVAAPPPAPLPAATPIVIVVTATPASSDAPASTMTPTLTPTDQGLNPRPQGQGLNLIPLLVGGCLLLLLIGAIVFLLVWRPWSKKPDQD